MPYGVVDTADLKMTSCDFEKDANAEVLFDKGVISNKDGFIELVEHERIKIFNDFGKDKANIHLVYYVNPRSYVVNNIAGLEAETINLENGKIKITPVEKSQIYLQKPINNFKELVFTFPDVKAGSIIEFKYKSLSPQVWYFQSDIPTRYSELETDFLERLHRRSVDYVTQPYVMDTGTGPNDIQVKALGNVHSAPAEPFMGAPRARLQRIEFFSSDLVDNSWQRIIGDLLNIHTFSNELSGGVDGDDNIIAEAKKISTKDEKIAFLFDTVRNYMKWNGVTAFTSVMGKSAAWVARSGNSVEINLTLYHFLKRAGIVAFPLMVGSRKGTPIDSANANRFSISSVVIYVPVDAGKYYVLDASNKFSLFNTIPQPYLDSYGILLDPGHQTFNFIRLKPAGPATTTMFIDARMDPNGKINGYTEINSFGYSKIRSVWAYKSNGKDKFIDSLLKTTDGLKISSFQVENIDCDTLPFTEKINFTMDIPTSNGDYLYLGANFFSLAGKNPFASENRFSDIDFSYNNNISVSGSYSIANGYKVESLPKSITSIMPDGSIVFKRTIAQENGTILIRYAITHKAIHYRVSDYPDLRAFYKEMYELLNEPIVLKKE
jgi:hypothetical protein